MQEASEQKLKVDLELMTIWAALDQEFGGCSLKR